MKLLRKTKILVAFWLILLPVFTASAEPFKRIVSLAPSITESLYQLQVQDYLLGVTSYCNHPPQAKTKEIIGTLINPSVEKIYSLSPDLVLTVEGINRPQAIERLQDLGLKVVAFNKANNLDDIIKNFVQLGSLLGREEKAEEIIKEVEAEISLVTKKIESVAAVRTFWEVGANPLVSAGGESFANEFIRYCGGINIFADSFAGYPRVSREEVLKRDPEVIVLVTMGDVTEKEKTYWKRFKDLKAARFNRIYVVDADKVCRPTPVSFLAGLKEVARILHPEIF